MSTRPSFQWYPGDWLRCLELRRCSPLARALWADLLCLMHFGEPYGHLATGGVPLDEKDIARATGFTASEVRRGIAELERFKVCARADGPEGAIFSRRMVRDEAVRVARAKGGEAGSEHGSKGASHGSKGGRPRKSEGGIKTPLPSDGETPVERRRKPSPSSSSASAPPGSRAPSPSAQELPPSAARPGEPPLEFGAGTGAEPGAPLPSSTDAGRIPESRATNAADGPPPRSADRAPRRENAPRAAGDAAPKRRGRGKGTQQTTLLDGAEPPPAEEQPSAVHSPFIAWWCQRFEVETGQRYPFTPRDAKRVAEICELAREDLALMQHAAERYFASDFYRGIGFDLETLKNKFAQFISASPERTHVNAGNDRRADGTRPGEYAETPLTPRVAVAGVA